MLRFVRRSLNSLYQLGTTGLNDPRAGVYTLRVPELITLPLQGSGAREVTRTSRRPGCSVDLGASGHADRILYGTMTFRQVANSVTNTAGCGRIGAASILRSGRDDEPRDIMHGLFRGIRGAKKDADIHKSSSHKKKGSMRDLCFRCVTPSLENSA